MSREAGDIDMSSKATFDRNASTLFFTELFRGMHLIFCSIYFYNFYLLFSFACIYLHEV